jgi:hypothetical protein
MNRDHKTRRRLCARGLLHVGVSKHAALLPSHAALLPSHAALAYQRPPRARSHRMGAARAYRPRWQRRRATQEGLVHIVLLLLLLVVYLCNRSTPPLSVHLNGSFVPAADTPTSPWPTPSHQPAPPQQAQIYANCHRHCRRQRQRQKLGLEQTRQAVPSHQ